MKHHCSFFNTIIERYAMTTLTRWYIESKDARTNEVIATAMEGLHSAEKFVTLVCSDDKKHELAEVRDYAFVARLLRSQKNLNLKFVVFRSQGNGKPAPWKFASRKKTTLEKMKQSGKIASGTSATKKNALRF